MVGRTVGEETRRFRADLLADVLEHAETEGQEAFLQEAFTDLVLDDLEQSGEWPDYQLAHFTTTGARVDAWGIDELRRILFLAVSDFGRTESAPTIGSVDVQRLSNRLVTFAERARGGRIVVEDHNPVADLVEVLRRGEGFDEIRIHVLVDRVSASSPTSPRSPGVGPEVRVWDLESIRRIRTSGLRLDPINVDLGGLPALDGGGAAGVETYLLFVPARVLADLYQEHGARLLERNVRAFLSARGKVNRGLRETLRTEPERFLAYNNGLTATAAGVDVDETTRAITRIRDLQIVNGGQTTASIAQAAKDATTGLDGVAVQMKLVVVDPDLIDELVPNISRYANSQNSVQESDLSANHAFLRKMEEASRTEYTPPSATGRPTKWYFERARGAHGVDEGRADTAAARRRFESDYPRGQKFGKNDMAVYENTWNLRPHLVSRGGQKNFTEFMIQLQDVPPDLSDRDADAWYRDRFRQAVSKAIVFKATDRAVQKALTGTYKRAVVSYTLSYVLARASSTPDLDQIWRAQGVAVDYIDAVVETAREMKSLLIESAEHRNITEWAKHENCWKLLREADLHVPDFGPSALELPPPRVQHTAAPVTSRGTLGGDPPRPDGRGERLSSLIEKVHGEPIDGKYRRYRRNAWRHQGDTGVPASRSGTLHAYEAEFTDKYGDHYVFNVVVDFPTRQIIPVEQLGPEARTQVEAWLQVNA